MQFRPFPVVTTFADMHKHVHVSHFTVFPPRVTTVLITPKGAESPGSCRIGVIGALVFFPSIRDRRGQTFLSLAGPVAH